MSSLHITRTLSADVERVWAAVTDADALAAWFWPPRLGPKVSADVRVGGSFRIDATLGGFAVSGTYHEVTPPTRLVMSWRWDGDTDESVVTIELTPRGDSTELNLRHDQIASDEARDQHAQGWNDCLDRLGGWLAGAA
jgi:uncharacterized protein YndB with AHSA1/START domain